MSQRIDALVLGLLRADRTQRVPQSAAEVAEALRALLEGRPARPISGPQAGSGSIFNAPTQRSSQPVAGVNPYAPTERAAVPPGMAATTPSAYTPQPGYQHLAVTQEGQKEHSSKKAVWSMWLGILSIPLAVLALVVLLTLVKYDVDTGGEPTLGKQGDVGRQDMVALYHLLLFLLLLFLDISAAIIAVVLGHLAKRDIRDSSGGLGGEKKAKTGLWLGYLYPIVVIMGFALSLWIWNTFYY